VLFLQLYIPYILPVPFNSPTTRVQESLSVAFAIYFFSLGEFYGTFAVVCGFDYVTHFEGVSFVFDCLGCERLVGLVGEDKEWDF
jgi:hypothetical protein